MKRKNKFILKNSIKMKPLMLNTSNKYQSQGLKKKMTGYSHDEIPENDSVFKDEEYNVKTDSIYF